MLSSVDFYRRAVSGEICNQGDFDLKRFIPAVRELVKKHGIVYTPETPIPSDDDLAERVWQAGRELFLRVGVYCVDTERVVAFDELELDQALAEAPRGVVLGEGQQARAIPTRRPESAIEPFFSLGACGAAVTSDDVFASLTQADRELPHIDAVASPAMAQIDGLPVVAGSPLEVEGCLRTVAMTREAARRAGRPGLGISNLVPTGVKAQGNIAGGALAGSHDVTEIGNIAELKIDFDNLSRVAFRTLAGSPRAGRHRAGDRRLRGWSGRLCDHARRLSLLRAARPSGRRPAPVRDALRDAVRRRPRRHLGAVGGDAGGHHP